MFGAAKPKRNMVSLCNRETKARGGWTSLLRLPRLMAQAGLEAGCKRWKSLHCICAETLKALLGAREGGRESWKWRREIGYTVEERAP